MKLPKETVQPVPLHGRWYADACGTAFAMELLGERWSLLIVRELIFGGRRFSDIRVSLPGISAKVLTERLESLEQSGVIIRRQLPPPIKAQVYELTAWGYAAEPLIIEAGRWAAQSSAHNPTLPLSAASLMLSMRTMVDRGALPGVQGRVGFVIGEESFVAEPGPSGLPIRRAGVEGADAIFRAADAALIAGGIYAGIPWERLERESGVVIEGNRDLAMRYAALFSLPPPLA